MSTWPGEAGELAAAQRELVAADRRPIGLPSEQHHLPSRADRLNADDGSAA